MGPFEQAIFWSSQGVKGTRRFLEKAWRLSLACAKKPKSSVEARRQIHKLNKKISEDLKQMKFNTAVAAFMEFVNVAQEHQNEIGQDVVKRFLILLAPFAPHITEELWSSFAKASKDKQKSIHQQPWPKYDPKLIKKETFNLIIQINGRVRDKIEAPTGISEEEVKDIALSRDAVKKWVERKQVRKIIFIPGRLINIVV